MQNEQSCHRVKKRIETKIGFYTHATIYVVVNSLFSIIRLTASSQCLWFKGSLIGWGIGADFHAM
jgi:ABC-type uncharacterized transport system fused permease/ATPase subunit